MAIKPGRFRGSDGSSVTKTIAFEYVVRTIFGPDEDGDPCLFVYMLNETEPTTLYGDDIERFNSMFDIFHYASGLE